jgi:1,4-alpha-glucan branching enzyme
VIVICKYIALADVNKCIWQQTHVVSWLYWDFAVCTVAFMHFSCLPMLNEWTIINLMHSLCILHAKVYAISHLHVKVQKIEIGHKFNIALLKPFKVTLTQSLIDTLKMINLLFMEF